MKFLCLCYYDVDQFRSLTPEDGKKIAEMCAPHDKEFRGSGHVSCVGSLGLPDQSKTLRVRGDAVELEDGPFINSKEPIGAFFLIEALNVDEATSIASMHPAARIGHIFGGGIEICPVEKFDMF